MPCSVRLDASTGVVVVAVDGEPSVDEIGEAVDEICGRPEYHRNPRVAWDLRRGGVAHLSTDELQQIARFLSEKRADLRRFRVALLVGREVDYGVLRMLGAFLSDEPLEDQVFRDAEAAWAWLTE